MNGVSLSQCDTEGTVIYPTYPMMNHSCACNTMYTISPSTRVIEVRAKRRIVKGEEISTRYIPPTKEQPSRSEYLTEVWGFRCSCPRCQSPSELGSDLSSLRCDRCDEGHCGHVMDTCEVTWPCDTCHQLMAPPEASARLARCRAMLGKMDRDSVETMEAVLSEARLLLHNNHSYCVQIKTDLVSRLARVRDKTPLEADRQLELAEEILAVLEVTDPGLSPRRAGLLRHVVELRTAAATRKLRAGDIERKQHGEIMAGNMTMMREVMMCAKYSTVFKI